MTIPKKSSLTGDRAMLILATTIDIQLLSLHDLINKFHMSEHPYADECSKDLRLPLPYAYAKRVVRPYLINPRWWEEIPGSEGALRQKICLH